MRTPPPPEAPEAPEAHTGRQRGVHAMTHRIDQRQVQRVTREAVVEGVATDVGGGLQPSCERERCSLTGPGLGKQPLLDLGGEAECPAPLAPLEEIGVPAAGDDDEGQQMGDTPDLLDHLPLPLGGVRAAAVSPWRQSPVAPTAFPQFRATFASVSEGGLEPPRPLQGTSTSS
jgi:hypothetical protein